MTPFAKTSFALLAVGSLAGCYVPPPVVVQQGAPSQVPLVAVPGPGKTEAQFHQDDAACRTAPPIPARPGPAGNQAGAAVDPPGVAYLRCMTAHNDTVEPLAPEMQPVLYGYYPAYPVYAGIDYGFPVFYGEFGFGFGGYRDRFYGGGFDRFGFGRGGFERGGFERGGFDRGGGGFDRGGGFERGGGGFNRSYSGGGFGRR